LWMLPALERKYCLKELCYKSLLDKFPAKDVITFLYNKLNFLGDPLVPHLIPYPCQLV